uniref:Uncharacterized protein n=1 Tax=Anguilla anguilla TaxID=7936 RepID=A0A0E9S0V1_ANGAN
MGLGSGVGKKTTICTSSIPESSKASAVYCRVILNITSSNDRTTPISFRGDMTHRRHYYRIFPYRDCKK